MQKEFTLGYFIQERHIDAAIKLLKKQVDQSSPLYNTLDFKIYNEEGVMDSFDSKVFYESYVKNDVFYYFQDKFFIREFVCPQGAYKIRKYHYLSFDLLVVFYAVGFYVHELLARYQSDVESVFSKRGIKVYYGGRINHQEPEKSNVFYYDDYQEFVLLKEEISKPEEGFIKYVLTLDIKSFFYTISHKILFQTIGSKASDFDKKRLGFDENTVSSLEFLFKFLMKNNEGIPVSSQNLIANYLSSIYFSHFDEFVCDYLMHKYNLQYIRYVDDFYLVFKVKEDENVSIVRSKAYNIENEVSEFLSVNLGLSVSPDKSKRGEIKDVESHKKFLSDFKSESLLTDEVLVLFMSGKIESIEDTKKKAPEVFDECVSIIRSLKHQLKTPYKLRLKPRDSNYLNNILIAKDCLNYSRSKKAQDLLEKESLFLDYQSIDYVLFKMKVFLYLITINGKNREYLIALLKENLENENSIDQTLVLIEKLVLQLEFLKSQKKPLISEEYYLNVKNEFLDILRRKERRLQANSYFLLLQKMLDNNTKIVRFCPLYDSLFLNQKENISLVQQIKQRRLNEEIDYYNVAFNHFLNEFQHLYEIAFLERTKATALEIKNSMVANGYRIAEVTLVSDFFNRRNQNSISHTNDIDIGFWGVSQRDYQQYKNEIYPIQDSMYKRISGPLLEEDIE